MLEYLSFLTHKVGGWANWPRIVIMVQAEGKSRADRKLDRSFQFGTPLSTCLTYDITAMQSGILCHGTQDLYSLLKQQDLAGLFILLSDGKVQMS